ncbi:MAG: rod shape-determining protein MreC [Gammaproteobacteria bacterium]|nr:rod shape-determining protein MreC [Gammaproteobacteria bacterium]
MLVTPVVVAADFPNRTVTGVQDLLATRDEMVRQISELESELLLLKAKTEKMAALTAENNRLRALLGSACKVQDNVLVAELIGVDPDPESHEVIVDKGTRNNVFVGQPVLDAAGLMGQVIEAGPLTSRVLLISDPTDSVPIQVARSNLRLIAQGSGVSRELQLMHVQRTADIEVGYLPVSSGLGDRFPRAIPVGVVNRIDHDRGKPFADVTATPSAALDRSRHVLLVFNEDNRRAAELPDSAELPDGRSR